MKRKFWGDEPLEPEDPRVKFQNGYEAMRGHTDETGHMRFRQTENGYSCREGDWEYGGTE